MGLFSSKKNGGILNVIRCDEDDYLVWKWRPSDMPSTRENAIRWGSTLHVKEGEVAVFVYKQNDGKQMDYFEGPLDTTLKTANFPVLSSIMGLAYGGDTPFQAEVYFINLAGNVKMPFFINQFMSSKQTFHIRQFRYFHFCSKLQKHLIQKPFRFHIV
ncbi:MAG: SPFH domain-containing protein [Bacteroidales bacterium]|nr:SPFH domain-containing protein [Bacteroidales bacterium]